MSLSERDRASALATQICGCATAEQHQRDIQALLSYRDEILAQASRAGEPVAATVNWLRSLQDNGHCGEGTSERIQRERRNEHLDIAIKALTSPPNPQARIEALEADAARYRYLRDRDPGPDGQPVPQGLFVGQVPNNLILTGEDADRAIDAALNQGADQD